MSTRLSPLGAMIRRLLDESGRFSRGEWAAFLGVSRAALSQWANDRTVPQAELLARLIRLLRESDNVPAALLEDFDRLCVQSAEDISPHGKRLGASLGEYLVRPTFKGFMRVYEALPTHLKEEALFRAAEECRSLARQQTSSARAARPHESQPRRQPEVLGAAASGRHHTLAGPVGDATNPPSVFSRDDTQWIASGITGLNEKSA